jgi:hypothetical protein
MSHRSKGGAGVLRRFIVPVSAIVLLIAAIFRIGVQKDLVSTFTGNEWGRYLFAMGATLTQQRWGIGGYVIDSALEGALNLGGLTTSPETLGRLGTKYPENLHNPNLMQQALDRALHLELPPPDQNRLRGSHGDDVGLVTFTALAFSLFGVKIGSLYYTYFVLLSASVVTFVITYRRSSVALSCAILMLLALYALCSSDVVNLVQQVPPFINGPGSDIKDPRFFGTLAAIPALHVLLASLLPARRFTLIDYAGLVVQAALLAFAIHVRWPVLWIVPALVVSVATSIIVRRAWRELVPAAVFATTLAIGINVPSLAAHPIYGNEGDLLHHPLWHNMLTSLESHPAWRERYLPTVNGATGDDMPGIVARQEIAKLPPEQRSRYFYPQLPGYPTPEAVNLFARKKFFEVARKDPRIVIESFTSILPHELWQNLAAYHASHAAVMTLPVLAVMSVALCVAIWTAAADTLAAATLLRLTIVAMIFSGLAAVPALIGSTHPLTLIDHVLWFFFTAGLACTLLIVYIAAFPVLRPARAGP